MFVNLHSALCGPLLTILHLPLLLVSVTIGNISHHISSLYTICVHFLFACTLQSGDSLTMSMTTRYDIVYLTYSKKLTCSQLSLPHGTNRTT